MYNRYIPQPDGTYRRNRIQPPPGPPERICEPQEPPCAPPPPPPPPEPSRIPKEPSRPARAKERPREQSAASFLKRLLPGDFDTGDLMVVLLLLLMAGDCQEEQNNALLTLALYLFL